MYFVHIVRFTNRLPVAAAATKVAIAVAVAIITIATEAILKKRVAVTENRGGGSAKKGGRAVTEIVPGKIIPIVNLN